ncbi:MAG: macro domain-containing protein [Omnitrophica WOR_2 bacterium]
MNQVLRESVLPSGTKVQIVQGDITVEEVDAIVNAANSALQHGGGVAAAIARRGGPEIQADSDAWIHDHGPVRYDEPAYTRPGRLPSRYVIHAVGPVWGEGNEDAKLAATIRGSLQLADRLDLTSIAFPAISTGIFGFPKERAAGVILSTFQEYFNKPGRTRLELARLVLFDQPTVDAFLKAWDWKNMDNDDHVHP